jgi:beta-glucosidase
MKKIALFLFILSFTGYVKAQVITPEVEQRAEKILSQMTLREKIDYIGGYNAFYIRAVERLGLPEIRMADGPQGVRNDTRSTMFPCGIAAASTWNRQLVNKMGQGLGQDCRARGVHVILGPGVNIYRSPLSGRSFEYYGEDPYLASETAVQYIKGVQSQGVISTIKHFAANNQEWDRNNVSSDVDERTMQEIYWATFRKAVEQAHVGAVMTSYNLINGVHASEYAHMNIDVLRNMWGFKGILMSDWTSVYSTVGAANGGLDLEMPGAQYMTYDKLKPAIENGLVKEATIDNKVRHILQTIIAFGFLDRPQLDPSISEKNAFSDQTALDVAREGIVLLKNENNMVPLKKGKVVVMGPNSGNIPTGGGSGFVNPFSTVSVKEGMKNTGKYQILTLPDPTSDITSDAFFTATGSQEKGLKGEYFKGTTFSGSPVLTRTDAKVDFTWDTKAPAAGMPVDTFSVRWTGVFRAQKTGTAIFKVTGDDGYRLYINDQVVLEDWGNHAATTRETNFSIESGKEYKIRLEYYENAGDALCSLACATTNGDAQKLIESTIKTADAVVLCVGFSSRTEGEGSDRSFSLPAGQDELIDQTLQQNKNVILVVNAGGGFDMSKWESKVRAILLAWYPGQEGGQAIAEIISGKISPSGKLPITIEKRWEDNPDYNSYYDNRKGIIHKRVQYSEGVFTGYRGYDKSGIEPRYPFGYGLSYTTFAYSNLKIDKKDGHTVTVTFDVKNTGNLDGAEIAEVYVGDVKASVPRPLKELKGYEKVFLKKGETKTVTVQLADDAFSFYDVEANKFVVEPGDFIISVGTSSKDLPLKGTVTL